MLFGIVRRAAKLCGLATVVVVALWAERAGAQPGHDAFDKPLGYDTGREEQAAHNYLNRTGEEDVYGESQGPVNRGQNGFNSGNQQTVVSNQNGQLNDSRRVDDDDARHHAALGVSLRESEGHVAVIAVLPGSPASRAGLRVGDEIRYVGDQRIATAQGLADEIVEYRPGSQVDLSIRRNGEKRTLTARLGSRQPSMSGRNRDDDRMASRQNIRDGRADGRQMRYSVNPTSGNPASGQQRSQVSQQLQGMQQRLSQIQQELNNLRASLEETR